jgi:hypothetical protein
MSDGCSDGGKTSIPTGARWQENFMSEGCPGGGKTSMPTAYQTGEKP